MDIVIRGALVYFFVWLILRLAGKRSLGDLSSFDLVLLLLISETTNSALHNGYDSITSSLVLVVTLVGIDIGLSLVKEYFQTVEKVMDGLPLVLLEDGKPIEERLKGERVDVGDILNAARKLQGLERLDQIKYAVLERSGGITIIPHDAPPRRFRRRKTSS